MNVDLKRLQSVLCPAGSSGLRSLRVYYSKPGKRDQVLTFPPVDFLKGKDIFVFTECLHTI